MGAGEAPVRSADTHAELLYCYTSPLYYTYQALLIINQCSYISYDTFELLYESIILYLWYVALINQCSYHMIHT